MDAPRLVSRNSTPDALSAKNLTPAINGKRRIGGLSEDHENRLRNLIQRFLELAARNPIAGSLVLSIGDLVLKCFDA